MMAGREEIRAIYQGYMHLHEAKYSPDTISLIEKALKYPLDIDGVLPPPLIPSKQINFPWGQLPSPKAEPPVAPVFNFDKFLNLNPEPVSDEPGRESFNAHDVPGAKMPPEGWASDGP